MPKTRVKSMMIWSWCRKSTRLHQKETLEKEHQLRLNNAKINAYTNCSYNVRFLASGFAFDQLFQTVTKQGNVSTETLLKCEVVRPVKPRQHEAYMCPYPKNRCPWNWTTLILRRPISSLSNISKAEGLLSHSLLRNVEAVMEPLQWLSQGWEGHHSR